MLRFTPDLTNMPKTSTMPENKTQRPLAPLELEERAKEIFPIEMTPEEFAGRDGEGWAPFPFGDYQYRDEQLDAWIQQFGKILVTPGAVELYQMKYLTPQERNRLAALKAMIEDDF